MHVIYCMVPSLVPPCSLLKKHVVHKQKYTKSQTLVASRQYIEHWIITCLSLVSRVHPREISIENMPFFFVIAIYCYEVCNVYISNSWFCKNRIFTCYLFWTSLKRKSEYIYILQNYKKNLQYSILPIIFTIPLYIEILFTFFQQFDID